MSKKGATNRQHLTISSHCNNNCVFCMERNDRKHQNTYIGNTGCKEMTVALLKKILPRLNNSKPIVLTSGEPTLAKELLGIILLLKNKGFKDITLQTNGRMLTHMDYCVELVKAGINSFSISIHGSNYKIHEALTRTCGSFQQTFSGIENLLKLKKLFPYLKIITTTTVNKLNIKDIQNLLKMLIIDRPLINVVVLNPISLRGNALIYSRHLAISYTDIFNTVRQNLSALSIVNNDKITITDLPMCINDFYSGPSEDISLTDIKLNQQRLKLKAGEKSLKRKECMKCAYYNICAGISKEYIKIFGWNEFSPVIKNH